MKKHQVVLTVFVFALLLGCKKTPGGGGGGTGGGGTGGGGTGKPKKWFIKSFASKYDASHFAHTVFVYDSALSITRTGYGLSGLKDTFDQSIQSFTDYTYKDGKLVSSKPFQSPGIKYVYLDANSLQVTPDPYDPAHDGVSYFYFNARGRGELDQTKSVIPPGVLFAGTTAINYIYNDLGGLQGESDLQGNGTNTDAFTFMSEGVGTSIDNPFSNGTTLEQRFIYSMNDPFGTWDMLGPKWSNGVFESYSYGTGQKVAQAHFWNQHRVDSNGNVVEVTKQYTDVTDKTGTVTSANPIYVTYEQH